MFELGKPCHYTIQNVEANDFLNEKLENDRYGFYYSVKFEGDAETFLMQAKTTPEAGETYFGHIERSKSGKSLRFKKDKEEASQSQQASSTQSTEDSIARAVALKAAVEHVHNYEEKLQTHDIVIRVADIFLKWLTGSQVEGSDSPNTTKAPKSLEARDEEPDPQWSGEQFDGPVPEFGDD